MTKRPFIRRVLVNPKAMFGIAGLFLVLHIICDHKHVERCGALWVIFGACLIARPVIRVGYEEWRLKSRIIDGATFDEATPEEKEEMLQDELDARCVQVFGPLLGVAGTLLWAYGSLLYN
jgi:hypothetical protein